MKRLYSITTIALTGLMGLSIVSAPLAAGASEAGKRNTALGLGVAAAALLLTQHNKLPGLLAGGGAVYAYSQYNNDVQARHRREQYGDYDNRQDNGNRYNQHNNAASDTWDYRANNSQNHNDNQRNGNTWNNQDSNGRRGRTAH